MTKEIIEKKLKELEEGKIQLLANLNAQEGAIQLCKELLKSEEVKEDETT